MKSPNHSVPSGDRTMARALIAALEAGGASVDLASELRIYDGKGSQALQAELIRNAQSEIARLTAGAPSWQAWVTYHNYYKAPDLIGPAVARACGIPYLLIEATRARKRLTGPWAAFAQAAETACDAATEIFFLTKRDAETLYRDAPHGQRITHLRPFLRQTSLPERYADPTTGPMLSVGMFRAGDKLASYQLIAETLAHLTLEDWRLDIVGDGPARSEVKTLMRPFGPNVRFLGAMNTEQLAHCYANARLFFWPGVNEAFGQVYLEAQAMGLPVVAQDRPGVRDVLAPGSYPAPKQGAEPLAQMLTQLLKNPPICRQRGQEARVYIRDNHLMGSAASTLGASLAEVMQ